MLLDIVVWDLCVTCSREDETMYVVLYEILKTVKPLLMDNVVNANTWENVQKTCQKLMRGIRFYDTYSGPEFVNQRI